MLNNVVLVGRLTKNPEVMENQDGSKFTIINLAIPRPFKNEDGIYESDFVDITLLNGVAANTCEYCHKGDLMGIKGRIQNLSDTAQLQIVAEKVTFLSSKKSEE